MTSMLKYFNDRGGESHGGELHWPGTADGYPMRTNGSAMPDLKQSEFENLDLGLDYHFKIFKLWEPEDAKAFQDVMDRIQNGWYMQRGRDDRWIESENHYQVFLEWSQIYGEVPLGKVPPQQSQGENHGEAAPGFGHTTVLNQNGAGASDPGTHDIQNGQLRQIGTPAAVGGTQPSPQPGY